MGIRQKRQYTWFILSYRSRIGSFSAKVPKKILDEVIKIQTKFYRSNREEMLCDAKLYEKLLPIKGSAQTLSDKMSMGRTDNCICGKKLKDGLVYCSGKCMLDSRNGELSTK